MAVLREEREMVCGPKGSEEDVMKQCSVCGRRGGLVELPGREEKYCRECSADVATSILLATEIDAATLTGRDAEELVEEFGRLSGRLLARAQMR
jgi:hypothetical protein